MRTIRTSGALGEQPVTSLSQRIHKQTPRSHSTDTSQAAG
ncbi:hypothetical protein BLL52_1011 [Rhodoferax antarcticus ANT.BR]|uniref:Uncharacterized protein n=1 Tax=Rhodoferax antarcticus ANT.BR TaxID=1111071 RepID=A0A1Q8YIX5_9BURK|nr:hypothetical protein BLL52_1011 [Rhodoferax antarcticus ANT.BR]